MYTDNLPQEYPIDCLYITKDMMIDTISILLSIDKNDKTNIIIQLINNLNFDDYCNDPNTFVKMITETLNLLGLSSESNIAITNFIKKYLDIYFNSCPKTFCKDDGSKKSVNINCDEYKNFIISLINLKTTILPDIIKKYPDLSKKIIFGYIKDINSLDNLCDLVSKIGIEQLINIIKSSLTEQGITLTDKQIDFIKYLLNCLCPTPSPIPTPKSISEYNLDTIYILAITISISIFILFLILIGIYYALKVNLSSKKLFITFIILILLGFGIFMLIVYLNPKCYFKNCIQHSLDWVPIDGNYKGSIVIFGIQIDVDVNIKKDNTVSFNKLLCTGNLCPFNDVLSKCVDDKTAKINTTTKTDQGYQVYSGCIDKMYEFKNNDGTKIVESIYVQNIDTENKLNVITVLNGCLGNICIKDLILQIPLTKQN